MIDKNLKLNILISTILLFTIGSFLHFAYEFSNNNILVGLFTPVNESIFEHLKLSLYPIMFWWIIFFLLKKNKYSLDKNKWFLGALTSIIVSIILIPTIYYLLKCGIGIEQPIINIIILYISLLISQYIGFHVYEYSANSNFLVSVIIITLISISFIILTIFSPKIPLFKDYETNSYGITD